MLFDALIISGPRPFGPGVRLWWSYGGRVRDVIAPNVRAAREVIAAELARVQRIPGVLAVQDERTGRVA